MFCETRCTSYKLYSVLQVAVRYCFNIYLAMDSINKKINNPSNPDVSFTHCLAFSCLDLTATSSFLCLSSTSLIMFAFSPSWGIVSTSSLLYWYLIVLISVMLGVGVFGAWRGVSSRGMPSREVSPSEVCSWGVSSIISWHIELPYTICKGLKYFEVVLLLEY